MLYVVLSTTIGETPLGTPEPIVNVHQPAFSSLKDAEEELRQKGDESSRIIIIDPSSREVRIAESRLIFVEEGSDGKGKYLLAH